MNIAQGLLNRARVSPDLPAISFHEQTTTFETLVDRVRRIAGSMGSSLGLSQGDRVVLYMENRPAFIETLFACWVAGLCAVPVNAKLHAREVAHIVEDCGARAIFTSRGLTEDIAGRLKTSSIATVVAGEPACDQLADGDPAACCDVSPSDPAWIFYTSGTTGAPKGAVLSHRNLLFMTLAYYADIEQVAPGQTMLHAAPLSHASGLYSLPHLFGGGHQVILSGFDPLQVLEALRRYEGVSMFGAPTMITRLVQAAAEKSDPVGNLRTIVYGGGPMYVNDLLKAIDVFGPRFFQLYGQGESPMTITGLCKADHDGNRDARHLARLGSCGTPRAGVEVRIVDETGAEVAVGEPGEIVTRSDCMMSAYWKNENATKSALRDGWLWTGDIGSLDEFGYLTLRDRSKDMIISGGTNIYPREIEEVLLKHPSVFECSVVGRKHVDWGEEAVAFVVLHAGETPSIEALDELCLQQIARFKRPRHYRFVETLPKNNYGKVLKTELRHLLESEAGNA